MKEFKTNIEQLIKDYEKGVVLTNSIIENAIMKEQYSKAQDQKIIKQITQGVISDLKAAIS